MEEAMSAWSGDWGRDLGHWANERLGMEPSSGKRPRKAQVERKASSGEGVQSLCCSVQFRSVAQSQGPTPATP